MPTQETEVVCAWDCEQWTAGPFGVSEFTNSFILFIFIVYQLVDLSTPNIFALSQTG